MRKRRKKKPRSPAPSVVPSGDAKSSEGLQALGVPCPTISDEAVRAVHCLIGQPEQTIQTIADELGVSRSSLKKVMDGLVKMGYVEETQKDTAQRGRPPILYSATNKAMRDLFENAQDIIWPAIWLALQRLCDPETVETIQKEVAAKLSKYYGRTIVEKNPRERVHAVIDFLAKQGRLLAMKETEDTVVVHIRSCPFYSFVEETGSMCLIHTMATQMLLGDSLLMTRLAHRNQEDQHSCVFCVSPNTKKDEYPEKGSGI